MGGLIKKGNFRDLIHIKKLRSKMIPFFFENHTITTPKIKYVLGNNFG